ncbi:MAG: hypothetical protein K1X53_12455 [Candidatus Sumerlaeaceae bacterium]|nr:hypothetical protein [Candidatus Sumerlaeaceae bacterium]
MPTLPPDWIANCATSAGGVMLALGLLGALCWTGYCFAAAVFPNARVSQRWAAAAVVAFWISSALPLALSPFRLFVLPVVAPTCCVLALVSWWIAARRLTVGERLWRDFSSLAEATKPFGCGPTLLLVVPLVFVVLVRFVRALIIPPMAVDALTYHLVKAADWLQSGGWVARLAPDSWTAYEYYPPLGDLPWAWAMLPLHGDALVGPAGFIVWAALALAVYGALRQLDCSSHLCLCGAALAASCPAILNFAGSAYVDNTAAALYACALLFLLANARERSFASALMFIASLALAAGVKHSMFPVLALGCIWAAFGALRAKPRAEEFAGMCVLAVVVMLPGLVGYIRAWSETGSFMYPMPLGFGPFKVHPGDLQNHLMMSGQMGNPPLAGYAVDKLLMFFSLTLFPAVDTLLRGNEFLNVGPAFLALLPFAAIGLRTIVRRKGYCSVGWFILLSGLVPVLGILSPDMTSQRTLWAQLSGRFLTPTLVAMLVLAAASGHPVLKKVFGVLVAVGTLFCIPRGVSAAELDGFLMLMPLLLAVVVMVDCLIRLPGTPARVALASGALFFLVVGLILSIGVVKPAARYSCYELAARKKSPAFDVHPMDREAAQSWPLWKFMDEKRGTRIAVASGYESYGHYWYWYPLFGSKLQNVVYYVSPTFDGTVPEYWRKETSQEKASPVSWIRRLAEQGTDYVVALEPFSYERGWMERDKTHFELVAGGKPASGEIYRFKSGVGE